MSKENDWILPMGVTPEEVVRAWNEYGTFIANESKNLWIRNNSKFTFANDGKPVTTANGFNGVFVRRWQSDIYKTAIQEMRKQDSINELNKTRKALDEVKSSESASEALKNAADNVVNATESAAKFMDKQGTYYNTGIAPQPIKTSSSIMETLKKYWWIVLPIPVVIGIIIYRKSRKKNRR